MRLLAAGCLLAAVAVGQLENLRVGVIDLYALDGLNEDKVRAALTVRVGDKLEWPATRDRIAADLSREVGRTFTHFAPICCDNYSLGYSVSRYLPTRDSGAHAGTGAGAREPAAACSSGSGGRPAAECGSDCGHRRECAGQGWRRGATRLRCWRRSKSANLAGSLRMSNEALFSFANMAVLPGWILLAVAPRSKWTQRYAALLVPLMLGPAYVVLIATNWGPGGFGTLDEVSQLFSNRALLLAGWIHYLIFDLFVGAWETRDAAAHGISRIVVIPCLLMTFLLGPAGLGAYLLMRLAWRRALDPQ